jgi:hypothetical protein
MDNDTWKARMADKSEGKMRARVDVAALVRDRGIRTSDDAITELRHLLEATTNGDVHAAMRLGQCRNALLDIVFADEDLSTVAANRSVVQDAMRMAAPDQGATVAAPDQMSTPEPVRPGLRVATESRADFRVNLTVEHGDRQACEDAGGVYDAKNKVMYAPPRTNLRPVAQWLPFDIEAVPADPASGMLQASPAVARAAVTPGTTSKGILSICSSSISSPPRPNT